MSVYTCRRWECAGGEGSGGTPTKTSTVVGHRPLPVEIGRTTPISAQLVHCGNYNNQMSEPFPVLLTPFPSPYLMNNSRGEYTHKPLAFKRAKSH